MTLRPETPVRSGLQGFFSPASVALIGATDREKSVGRTVLTNLVQGNYRGRVYPVNPSRAEVLGVRCYPGIGAIPETIDLAVVVTPAATVPGVIRECVQADARSAVVITAGFREIGAAGERLERQVQQEIRGSKLRVVGPNCLGMMNPRLGLNATFARDIAMSGRVAFLSQSGAMLTAILDWSLEEEVGFSAIVSTGSMLDVGWADLISFFGEDEQTQSLLLYLESVGDPQAFLSAAGVIARHKPIIAIKAGRSPAAAKAATSHTGALAGSDEVYDAAFSRCGVLRVQNISDLFYMADVLGKQPRPRGPRLTILTNAGGPGVLATDALVGNGGELAPLSSESFEALGQFLPPHWSHGNPIDILGDAEAERYARALEIAVNDPQSDGLLVILAPQGMTDPARVAERLKPYASGTGKPVLASWMGGKAVAAGDAILSASGIPTFPYPDSAARAFNYMWQYTDNIRAISETSAAGEPVDTAEPALRQVEAILERARAAGRGLLTEMESKNVLSLYKIPTVPAMVAATEDEAAAAARTTGFPVVLKVHSETIAHKTDVGGVKLNLDDEQSVRRAFRAIQQSVAAKAGAASFLGVTVQPMITVEGYELILGSSVDSQFGPVVLFGSGGQLVEVFRDHALALPPLSTPLAHRLIDRTRISRALRGIRGRATVDRAALDQLLARFSRLVIEHRRIKEIDVNPLLASSAGLLALDARIVLYRSDVADEDIPLPAVSPSFRSGSS